MKESPEIIIRRWEINDASSVAIYANNKNIFDNLRDGFPYPYSLKDARDFIQMAMKKDSSTQLFAIDLNGEAIGSIGGIIKEDIYRLNAEVGYWLAEEFWGKGIITIAIKLITRHLFEQFNIERIYAEPFSDNIASQKALEKAGYKLEARFIRNIIKNDVIKDSLIYSMLRSEFIKIRHILPDPGEL